MRTALAIFLFFFVPTLHASYISSGSGIGANVGTGQGNVYRDNTGGTINFKTLKQGGGIAITDNANDVTLTVAGAGLGNVTGPASAALGQLSSFAATDGTVIQAETGTGYAKATSGVPSYVTKIPIADGGTNSSTALNNNRVMQSSGGAVVEAAAITASRALVSDANGIPTHATTTATEIGYVNGVTSAIQTQINTKAPTASPTFSGTITTPLTASKVVTLNGSSQLAASTITAAALELLAPSEYNAGNSSTAITLDWTNGTAQKVTLTGNVTFTLSNPVTGTAYIIRIATGAGSFTATWPGTVKWSGGTAPTITATASKVDLINLYWDGTAYYGSFTQNY